MAWSICDASPIEGSANYQFSPSTVWEAFGIAYIYNTQRTFPSERRNMKYGLKYEKILPRDPGVTKLWRMNPLQI